MSSRHHHGDDVTSRRYYDAAPAPVSRPSRETIRSAIAMTETSSSTRSRGSRIRSLSESRMPRDTHERVEERYGAELRKRSAASLTKGQGSIYSREAEGTAMKSFAESRISRDVLDVEQHGVESRKRSAASLTKDQESMYMYSRETEGTTMKYTAESRIPRDVHERVDAEQYGVESRKRSATSLAKDQESMYSRGAEGTTMKYLTASESRTSRDVHERADVEQHGVGSRKRSATSLTKDQGSMYSREGEGTSVKCESRPPKEEGQHRYEDDRTRDRRDTLRGTLYSSPKETTDIHRPPPAHTKDLQPIAPSSASLQQVFEAQRELTALQREHRTILQEKQELLDALTVSKQQYEERSEKVDSIRRERRAAVAQMHEMHAAYIELKQQSEEQAKQLNAARQAELEQKQKVEEEYAALRQKYETQKNEYNALNHRHHSLKSTLEQRTAELQGVQKFLTTADTFSGSEVVNMLRKLNEEVQQTTTFMAEWAVEKFVLETPPASVERNRTTESLGMRLIQLLGTTKHKDNPILIEIAFRAYLIYELYWVASPWGTGQEEQSHNEYVDAIYQRIREAEGQAISGNWRALTRNYTLPACISDPEVARTFDTTIASGVSDILLAAGCTTPKSDIMSTLWSKFGEKIHHFVSLAGQVNKIIGVGVISEDFDVLVVWPDAVFDQRLMEDSYDNGDRIQGTEEREETVLCVTDFGLMQRMMVGAGAGQAGKPSELIVIKPKVALTSVADIVEG